MNPYIQSLRLRTLPLSMSGIVLGTGLAWKAHPDLFSDGKGMCVFALAILTTLSLQILSNLSNELGDAQKGTDTDQHGRAAYGLQAGTITEKQIKGMIWLFAGLCVVFGSALIYCAFWWPGSVIEGEEPLVPTLVFFGLGFLAMVGAVTYTLGKHSYGYMGLGDLGVFLFFGLLSTIGGYYLQTQELNTEVIWSGVAIGLPCVGVLNLNNIRDMNNDRAHGKRTLASMLGPRGAKVYHTCLLVGCIAIFTALGHLWPLRFSPFWAWHLWFIWSHEGSSLDKQMPVLMLSTLVVACLGWV